MINKHIHKTLTSNVKSNVGMWSYDFSDLFSE